MSQMKGIIDPLLTEASSMYVPQGFLADKILPEVKFSQYTGTFAGYGKSHLRLENSVIGGRGKYRMVEPIVRQTQLFNIQGHGLSGMVTKQDYKNVTDPYDAEKDETMGLTSLLQVEKESILAQALTNTSLITQNVTLSGSSQFSDYANSDVVSVLRAAKLAVNAGCGTYPNAVIMDKDVAEVLRFHPQMLDLLGFKFNRPGGLDDQELARALKLDKVFIADVKYNAAKEGQPDSLQSIWGKDMIFAVIPDSAAKYQTSLGYNIRLNDGQPRKVYKQSLFNPPGSTEILVEDEYDLRLTDVTAAYLVKAAIA